MNVDHPPNPAPRLVAAGLTLLVLLCPFGRGQSLMQYRRQIAESEQRLEKIRTTHDEKAEAIELFRLGELQAHADQVKAAAETENAALEICVRLQLVKEAAIVVQDLGWINTLLDNPQAAEDYYERALKMEEATGNSRAKANTLVNLGDLAFNVGHADDAFGFYNRALQVAHDNGNSYGEIQALKQIASKKTSLALFDAALATYNKALALCPVSENLKCQGSIFLDKALLDVWQDDYPHAVSAARTAVDDFRSIEDRIDEAFAFRGLSGYQLMNGDEQASAESFREAIEIHRELGDADGEAADYTFRGGNFAVLGKFQNALENFNHGLQLYRNAGNQRWEGETLVSIGAVYTQLGDDRKAFEYWEEARKIYSNIQFAGGLAWIMTLSSNSLANTGHSDKAIEFANSALTIWRQLGRRLAEATTLQRLGWVYESIGQHESALGYFRQALFLHQFDKRDLVTFYESLRGIGEAELHLGYSQQALVDDVAARATARAKRSPQFVGDADGALMHYWRVRQDPQLAAFFGIEAINSFQSVRKGIEGLGREQETVFVRSKAQVYHELAEILVQEDRLVEAEQVLDLLKEQELREVVRGESPDSGSKLRPLPLTAAQQKASSDLPEVEAKATALVDLNVSFRALLEKAGRSADEEKTLNSLRAEIEEKNKSVSKFFTDTLYPEFARRTTTDDANNLISDEKSGMSALQSTLARFGPNVVGIRMILGNEHGYALFITADGRTRFDLDSTPATLRKEILQVREELRNPGSDPRGHLADLYTSLLGPMKKELEALEHNANRASGPAESPAEGQSVPTILWSLDGSLRYLPIAALFDGRRYMVERFNNVLFTPESYIHMAELNQAPSGSRTLAMGLSKSYRNFPALPGVLQELLAVVHDPTVPASHGPLNGSILPDDKFTYTALKSRLEGEAQFPVIHIASHFVMDPGQGSEPYLLLAGDEKEQQEGYRLTLSTLDDSSISFRGTRLLTLSACSTGKPDALQNGMEVDSLAMIAQRKDAEAVLASLWDVNDASTSQFMADFYSRWLHNPSQGKAEALRQAQLALLQTPASPPGQRRRPRIWTYPEDFRLAGVFSPLLLGALRSYGQL